MSELKYYEGENISPEEAEEKIKQMVLRTGEQMKAFEFDVFSYYLSKYVDLTQEYRCLDAGCALGYVCYTFEMKTPIRMVGMDLSMRILIAGNRYRRSHGFNTELLAGDIEKLCFKDKSLDMVLIYNTLHHFPDFEVPLKSVFRILKEGGKLIIEDGNLLYWPLFWKSIRLKLKKQPWGTENEWPYTKFRLLKSLKKTGFKIICLRNIRYLPLSLSRDRLNIDDFIGRIPLINLFGSQILCIAQK